MSLEPMIDPDCRDPYKHGTCAGAPCQCPCHGTTPPVAAGPALPGGLDQLNNIEEAQQKLGGLGRTRIFHLLQTGELQSVKIGRRRFIPDSSLQQYIEGLKAAG